MTTRKTRPGRTRERAADPSRRRFIRLIAAGSAATLAAPAAAMAAPAKPRAARPARPRRAAEGPASATAPEIEKQKKYVADALEKIRAYELPPGSDMAFTFRPLKAVRARRGR